jgi:hypothetical protein
MRKYIFILNVLDIMAGLMKGKRFEGVLYMDKNTGLLTFKPYNRKAPKRSRDVLVAKLPWGWVKESSRRTKRHTSMPKDLAFAEKLAILDQENKLAKEALMKQELFNE